MNNGRVDLPSLSLPIAVFHGAEMTSNGYLWLPGTTLLDPLRPHVESPVETVTTNGLLLTLIIWGGTEGATLTIK